MVSVAPGAVVRWPDVTQIYAEVDQEKAITIAQ